MSTIIFTLCSTNYMSQAITLGDSIVETNPDIKFVIGLVDRIEHRKPLFDKVKHEVIEIESVPNSDWDTLVGSYDIIELNTAFKPYFFEYLFKTHPSADNVLYIDPDIMVFNPLTELLEDLKQHDVVLTPHILTPMPDDGKWFFENAFLNVGIYNLGFLALHRSASADALLDWWKKRLLKYCFIDFKNGFFTDQIWMNFAPLFFDNVLINKSMGYNVSIWNLHERKVLQEANRYYINDTNTPLYFYHFSSYKVQEPEKIHKSDSRFSFANRPDVVPLFEAYRNNMIANGYETFRKEDCLLKLSKTLQKGSAEKMGRKGVSTVISLIKTTFPESITRKIVRLADYTSNKLS